MEFESPAEARGFKASVKIDSTNIDLNKGITGTITFANLDVHCLAVFGCLLRKEEITATSTPINKGNFYLPLVTSYQNIQLTYGQPLTQAYKFCYSMPKNYSCETSTGKKSQYMVAFQFSIRCVLKSGHIITKSVPIVLYRLPPETPRQEEDLVGYT